MTREPTKQPSARTLTEEQAESLTELRASLMPEDNVGQLGGQMTITPRLGGKLTIQPRLGGSLVMSGILAIDSDMLVSWIDPVDKETDTPIGSGATGLLTLLDSNGMPVTGAVDIAATYAAGPPPSYRATIPNTVTLTSGATYTVEFVLTAAGGTPHGKMSEDVTAA